MKYLISLVLIVLSFLSFSLAESYIYFHQIGCPHCANVNDFFEKNNIMENYDITKKEITQGNNAQEFGQVAKSLGITDGSRLGVPFVAVKSGDKFVNHFVGDKPVINHFEDKIKNDPNYDANISSNSNQGSNNSQSFLVKNKNLLIFFIVILVLGGIGYYLSLTKSKNKKK